MSYCTNQAATDWSSGCAADDYHSVPGTPGSILGRPQKKMTSYEGALAGHHLSEAWLVAGASGI